MIVSTPYTECYVKKSFMNDLPNYGQDETEFGIIIAIRFIRARAPLFIVFFPEYGAVYDKIDQCAIFKTPETPERKIYMSDVAWWDSLSDRWQLVQIEFLKNFDIQMITRQKQTMAGKYLWTCDPKRPIGFNDYGQAEVWHEHKTKTFFFDELTGVLCCCPNNKMRVTDSSLSPKELKTPDWKVYKDNYDVNRISHETDLFLGDSENFNYED